MLVVQQASIASNRVSALVSFCAVKHLPKELDWKWSGFLTT